MATRIGLVARHGRPSFGGRVSSAIGVAAADRGRRPSTAVGLLRSCVQDSRTEARRQAPGRLARARSRRRRTSDAGNDVIDGTVRVAIIGAGAVSDYHHVPALRLDPRAELVAVCDADPGAARAAQGATGASTRVTTDPEALCATPTSTP